MEDKQQNYAATGVNSFVHTGVGTELEGELLPCIVLEAADCLPVPATP